MLKNQTTPRKNKISKKGYNLIRQLIENTNGLELADSGLKRGELLFDLDQFDEESSGDEKSTKIDHVNQIEEEITAKKAAQTGNLARLKFLIENEHIDPNQPDEQNTYLLHWAAINNRLEVVKYLVDEKGVRIDQIGGELEATPLHWAASAGHSRVISFLVKRGADVLSINNHGFTPLAVATANGNINAVAFFLAHGINVNENNFVPLY